MSSASQGLDRETRHRSLADMPAWRLELNRKLAASRARRTGEPEIHATDPGHPRSEVHGASRAASVAAAVAARYAKAPTYQELLAREAHIAAEAVVARLQAARDAAAAERDEEEAAHIDGQTGPAAEQALARRAELLAARVEVPREMQQHLDAFEARISARESRARESREGSPASFTPAPALLSDPVESVLVAPITPLAANLIEFPRELVAPRKARPRIAEGPLLDEPTASQTGSLRIVEVEREAESRRSAAPQGSEWSSIRLDTLRSEQAVPASALQLPLKTAPLQDRLMAALVDGALAFIGFLGFVLTFYATSAHPPVGKVAIAGAAATLACTFLLYQVLFFSYGRSTPGMRYARIALSTMEDKIPSRSAMRRRIGGILLATFPMGLGLLWAIFDEDRLGWHDRISGTYQRSSR